MTPGVVALVIVLGLSLAGCAGSSSAPAPTQTQTQTPTQITSPTAVPSESSSPSSTPTGTSASSADTCASLLDPATLKKGKAAGGRVTSFTAEDASEGGTLKKFLDYGGVACDFGPAQSDSPVLYGYGPITEQQAAKEKAHLDKLNMPSGTNEHGGTFYGAEGDMVIYVFSPAGYWAYQYNNGFGTQLDVAVIEEVVANAPTFY